MSKKGKKFIKTVIDSGLNFIKETLRGLDVTLSDCEAREFQQWCIKENWKHYQEFKKTKTLTAQNDLNDAPIAFPNGKQNEAYRHIVDLDMADYADIYFEGLEQTGLEVDINRAEGNITLFGTPTVARTIDFTLCAKLKEGEKGNDILKRNFNIAINPDPKDLWKDLPVPADLPFQKVNSACDYVLVQEFGGVPQKDIVAASKRGRSHAHEGKPRDDDFRVSFNTQNGWYVLVVADGAGSAKYSREGSRIACEEAEQYCKEQLAEHVEKIESALAAYYQEKTKENFNPAAGIINSILFNAAREAHDAIKRKAEEYGKDGAVMKDFATTLLITVCRKFDFGWLVGSFGVGDGAIAIYDKNADIQLLNKPDGGEYAGQTRFLTMDSIFSDHARTKIAVVNDFTALMLMTDGVSDPFFDTDANLEDKKKWDELWDNLSAAVDFSDDNKDSKNQLLAWLDFYIAKFHDDRTIAILY